MRSSMRRALALTASAIMLALVAAVPAQADPISDCGRDGSLNGNYTNGQLQNALRNLPTDLDEYTDCRDVIRGAMLSNASGGDQNSGSGGSNGAAGESSGNRHVKKKSRKEQRKLLDQATAGGSPVDVAGAAVTPGIGNGAANDLPGAVVAGFVGLALVGLGGGGLLAWRNPRIRRLFRRS